MTLHDTPDTQAGQPGLTEPDQTEALGQTDGPEPQRPPLGRGFSMRAAMIVPGLGVLILGLFITAGFLTSNPVQAPNKSTASATVAGTSLRAKPALADLRAITQSGEPPANILNSIAIPQGATLQSHQQNGSAAGQYDAQVGLRSDASQAAVDGFYQLDMKRQGWQIFEKGPADHDPGAIEVLGKKTGSDGFYWEMGAVVSATTFGPHTPPRGATPFIVRLFQVPDPD